MFTQVLAQSGGDVSSASTITPTGTQFRITGSTTIQTINLPYATWEGTLCAVSAGTWATGTSGNIAAASTPSPGQTQCWVYVHTQALWYPFGGTGGGGGGTGTVTGPGTTVSGFIAQWGNTIGTVLGTGLAVSATPAANTVVEAGGGGTISASWLPASITASTTGNSATSTALASTPTLCSAGHYPLGVDVNGNAVSCTLANGAVAGPPSSTVGFVPLWASAVGASLSSGLAVSATPAASTVVEAGAGGTISGSWLALTGDVSNAASVTTVNTVGTSTASNVHAAELLANAATAVNTAGTIVKRDGSGAFAAGAISGTSITAGNGLAAGGITMPEIAANGNNTITWGVPDSFATSYRLDLPAAAPPGVIYCPASGSNTQPPLMSASQCVFLVLSGTGTTVGTTSGTLTNTHLIAADANGNLIDSGTTNPASAFTTFFTLSTDATNTACANASDTTCFRTDPSGGGGGGKLPFAQTLTIPANTLFGSAGVGHGFIATACFNLVTPASPATLTVYATLGAADIYRSNGNIPDVSQTNHATCIQLMVQGQGAAGATESVMTAPISGSAGGTGGSWLAFNTLNPISTVANTNTGLTLEFQSAYSGTVSNPGNKLWFMGGSYLAF